MSRHNLDNGGERPTGDLHSISIRGGYSPPIEATSVGQSKKSDSFIQTVHYNDEPACLFPPFDCEYGYWELGFTDNSRTGQITTTLLGAYYRILEYGLGVAYLPSNTIDPELPERSYARSRSGT